MFLNTPTGIDDLAALDIAAVTLVLQGKFDDRLKELRAVKAAVDAAESKVETLAAAEKLLAEAQKRADEVAAFEVNVTKREQDAIAAAKSAADREVVANTLLKQIDEQNAAITKENTCQAAEQSQIDAGFAALADEKAKWVTILAAEKAAIEAEKKAFNDKLAALKA